MGGVCFMNFFICGFLNDFINSSGIIFEFHYNFIIFFCVWVPRFYTKNFNFFLPPIPPKKWLFWQNLAILALFGTFWIFFDHLYPPKKTKKILYWHNFAILAFFGTFGIFFTPYNPQKKPKNEYFDKIWSFWHFLALFWGGVKIAQKKIMLFKYSPLARQDSKNFYTHCFLIISQIILTGAGLSRNFLHLLFRTELQELTVHDISGLKFPKGDAIIHCI